MNVFNLKSDVPEILRFLFRQTKIMPKMRLVSKITRVVCTRHRKLFNGISDFREFFKSIKALIFIIVGFFASSFLNVDDITPVRLSFLLGN